MLILLFVKLLVLYGFCGLHVQLVSAQRAEVMASDSSAQNLCLATCSRHGSCIDGVCKCDTGWIGQDCVVFSPDSSEHETVGLLKDVAVADKCQRGCSNHGVCTFGVCNCAPGWFGELCSFRLDAQQACDPLCSKNGECVNGKCHCVHGFKGIDCSEQILALESKSPAVSPSNMASFAYASRLATSTTLLSSRLGGSAVSQARPTKTKQQRFLEKRMNAESYAEAYADGYALGMQRAMRKAMPHSALNSFHVRGGEPEDVEEEVKEVEEGVEDVKKEITKDFQTLVKGPSALRTFLQSEEFWDVLLVVESVCLVFCIYKYSWAHFNNEKDDPCVICTRDLTEYMQADMLDHPCYFTCLNFVEAFIYITCNCYPAVYIVGWIAINFIIFFFWFFEAELGMLLGSVLTWVLIGGLAVLVIAALGLQLYLLSTYKFGSNSAVEFYVLSQKDTIDQFHKMYGKIDDVFDALGLSEHSEDEEDEAAKVHLKQKFNKTETEVAKLRAHWNEMSKAEQSKYRRQVKERKEAVRAQKERRKKRDPATKRPFGC